MLGAAIALLLVQITFQIVQIVTEKEAKKSTPPPAQEVQESSIERPDLPSERRVELLDHTCLVYRHFVPKTLTPLTDYAERETYESPSSQRDRHVDVQRSLCRKVERTEGQGGTHHEGTRRENRDTGVDVEGLGIRESTADSHRASSRIGGSSRHYPPQFTPERVNSFPFSENSGKIFFAETLENKESGGFSERIFNYFTEFSYPPIAILPKVGYNRQYKEWGSFPHSKITGLESASNTRKSLTTITKEPSHVASANYTRLVFSSSDHDATNEGRTLT